MARPESDHEGLLASEPQPLEQPINSAAPRDKFYICHIAFFIIGLCQLLPWNFLCTATGFWMYKFRHINGSVSIEADSPDLQTVFDSYLAICSNLPFLLVFVLSFSKHLKKLSETVKNSVSFVLLALCFVSITAFVPIDTDKWQYGFLRLILVQVFLLNMVASFIQANFAGLASLLPNKIMHLMVTGQAMSGLFAVIAQIISIAGDWSIVQSTFAYFVLADCFILGTLVIYLAASRTEYFQFYNCQASLESSLESSNEATFDLVTFKLVFKQMWPFCITLMLNFWISLSLFPAVVVLVSPQSVQENSFWTSKYFLSVCCFLTYNLCDFLGRYLGQFFLLSRDRSFSLITIALLRIGFVPLFIFCNLHPRHLPVIFESEYYYISFMVLFGLSNGYLVLNSFVNGPLSVPAAYRKLSGFFLMLFLGLGLTLGSFTSTLLVRIL